VAVPLTYALGRSLYSRRIGLLAAAFVALSRWHVAISRVGLRFPFTPTFVALALLFLFRAFRHNRRTDWLACGLALGAGLHSYTAVRFVPLLLLVLTLVKLISDGLQWLRHRRTDAGPGPHHRLESTALSPRFWGHALLGAGASLLVFLPLLRYWHDEPGMFWFRAMTRISDAERALPGGPWELLWRNLKDALLMFNYRGGPVWVNTVPGDPVLDPVTGGLFVLGVVFVLWQLLFRGDRRGAYLLLSLFILLLPSALSLAFPEENPSVVRAGGAIPVVALLAALPVHTVVRALDAALRRRGRWRTLVLLGALFATMAALTYGWYFGEYAWQYRRAAANTTEMGRVARAFADSVGDLDHVYHIPYPWWAHTPNIGINAGDVTWNNAVEDLDDLQDHVADRQPKLYLLHVDDLGARNALQFYFPAGRLQRYESAVPGKDFLIYFVPGWDPNALREKLCPE
jgi:4-amino-4-deoxy-L-arabinose transferase-like glycosyltransferase